MYVHVGMYRCMYMIMSYVVCICVHYVFMYVCMHAEECVSTFSFNSRFGH